MSDHAPQQRRPTPEVYRRDILILGHPKCGTKYCSALFQAYGFDVRHEKVGENVISDWRMLFCADAGRGLPADAAERGKSLWRMLFNIASREKFTFDRKFLSIRHPLRAIWSIAVTLNNPIPGYERYRDFRQKLLRVECRPHNLDDACDSYFDYYDRAMKQEEFEALIIVEKAPEIMKNLFGEPVKTLPPNNVNSRLANHPEPEKVFDGLNPNNQTRVRKWCERYYGGLRI